MVANDGLFLDKGSSQSAACAALSLPVGSLTAPTNRLSIYERARSVVEGNRAVPTEVGVRLKDKIAIVVGAGQSPGEGLGNGRATVLRFAQEGAKVLAVDNNLSSAEETVAMARQSGTECLSFEADVTNETTLAAMVEAARRRWGRIDVLHYNVGVSIAGGDAPLCAHHAVAG